MKSLCHFLILTSLVNFSHADPLTATDKEQLREKLKGMMSNAQEKAVSRYADAARDFLAGMQSEDAAFSLYLKCVEKADFIDQDKKDGEYNAWKRKYDDALRDKNFKDALRHQLHWLIISMKASAQPDQLASVSSEAEKVLTGIFKNMEPRGIGVKEPTLKMDDHPVMTEEPLLEREVLKSAFARAYKIGDLKIENWPKSPFLINEIFDQAIMPPLRDAAHLKQLSDAWDLRIAMLQKKQQYAYGYTEAKQQKGLGESNRMGNFAATSVPDLQWQKEMDLYKAGDQKAAAVRMIKHLETYIADDHARTWVEQFQALMKPQVEGQ